MKNFFHKIRGFFGHKRVSSYEYPIDERQFEEDPLKIRTAEISQFQDEARDIETRTPEREAFEIEIFETIITKRKAS